MGAQHRYVKNDHNEEVLVNSYGKNDSTKHIKYSSYKIPANTTKKVEGPMDTWGLKVEFGQKSGPTDSLRRAGFLSGRLEACLMPFVPRSLEFFMKALFWHSIVMTVSTPLMRLVTGRWWGVLTPTLILSWLGLVQPSDLPYFLYEAPARKIDRAFGLHAFFALSWLILAFIQIVYMKGKSHRRFSSLTTLVFVGHMCAGAHAVWADVVGHTLLNKSILIGELLTCLAFFYRGVRSAMAGDIQQHRDLMVQCFVYSIEGAGTIRTVAFIQWLLGLGPSTCMALQGGMVGAECEFSYCMRNVWIRILSTFYLSFYVAYRQERTLSRQYWRDVRELAISALVTFTLLMLGLTRLLVVIMWIYRAAALAPYAKMPAKWWQYLKVTMLWLRAV